MHLQKKKKRKVLRMRFETLKRTYEFEGKEYEYEFDTYISKAMQNIIVDNILDLLLTEVAIEDAVAVKDEEGKVDKSDVGYIMQTIQSVAKPKTFKKRYNYAMKEVFIDFVIATMIGGVSVFDEEKDANLNPMQKLLKMEYFLGYTKVADIIKSEMNAEDLGAILTSVELNIQYITGVKSYGIEEAITTLLNTATEKIQMLDTEGVNEVVSIMRKIDPNGEINFNKLVDAYANSDFAKREVAKEQEAIELQRQRAKELAMEAEEDYSYLRGQVFYRYATSPEGDNMQNTPIGMEYVGMQLVPPRSVPSEDPKDYYWVKVSEYNKEKENEIFTRNIN